MNKKDLKESIIPTILKNISFIDYLKYNAYDLNEQQSQEDYLVFDRFDFSKKLLIEKVILINNNSHYRFKSVTKNDKGDIIDFVSNRIKNTQAGSKELNVIEACKRLLFFQSTYTQSPIGPIDLKSKSIKDFQEFFQNVYSNLYKLENSASSAYFDHIGITEQTLQSDALQGTMLKNTIAIKAENLEEFQDTCFILKNSNEDQVGIVSYNFCEAEASDFNFAPFSTKDIGLWFSNTIYNKVCLVSDPKEAFAYQELHPDGKYTFIAPPPGIEALSTYQIETIFNFVDKTNRYITLATSDTMFGNLMDLYFISRYTYETSNLIVIDTKGTHIEVMYKAQSKAEKTIFHDLISHIQKRNGATKKQISDYSDDNNAYLEPELFKLEIDRTKTYLIKIFIPRRNNQLHWFNKTLVRIKNFDKINFNKPQKNTWHYSLLKSKDLLERPDSIFDSAKISTNY